MLELWWCPPPESNRHSQWEPDFESGASTNSARGAHDTCLLGRARRTIVRAAYGSSRVFQVFVSDCSLLVKHH